MLTARRNDAHAATIRRLTDAASYYYHARPHPAEIHQAEAELKRGINDDWRASVQRYPEVLEYFYGLVDLGLPGDDETCVRDPPLSALGGGARKVRLRDPRDESRERLPPAATRRFLRPGAGVGDLDRPLGRLGSPGAPLGLGMSMGMSVPLPPPPPPPGGSSVGHGIPGGKRASFGGFGYLPPGAY